MQSARGGEGGVMAPADEDEFVDLDYSSQSKNNCLAEMWSSSEESSYVRLIDWSIPPR